MPYYAEYSNEELGIKPSLLLHCTVTVVDLFCDLNNWIKLVVLYEVLYSRQSYEGCTFLPHLACRSERANIVYIDATSPPYNLDLKVQFTKVWYTYTASAFRHKYLAYRQIV